MVFSEIYGAYYKTVAQILRRAAGGDLTPQALRQIVSQTAFAESTLTIPDALLSGRWPLLGADCSTVLHEPPQMPLTLLEKRWLKSLLLDQRIQLFSPDPTGLEEVEPLFDPGVFVWFDRYEDGDPYDDPGYVERFQTIRTAIREKRLLRVRFDGRHGKRHSWLCAPYRLEYSEKDDKFRLLAATPKNQLTLNLARIRSCELAGPVDTAAFPMPFVKTCTLVLELTDERNALERAMLHFSHLEKETVRLGENRYRITLRYLKDDETELLIRVLSFGPMLRVVEPEPFIRQLRERIEKQYKMRTG